MNVQTGRTMRTRLMRCDRESCTCSAGCRRLCLAGWFCQSDHWSRERITQGECAGGNPAPSVSVLPEHCAYAPWHDPCITTSEREHMFLIVRQAPLQIHS